MAASKAMKIMQSSLVVLAVNHKIPQEATVLKKKK
jgi:hypothetical protein